MTVLADGREVADTLAAPTQGYVPITPSNSTTYLGLRGIRANCTVAGNVTLVGLDGSQYVWPLVVGVNQVSDGVSQVLATGYTATATFYGLK
jgi:hypothetical protein